MLWNRLNGVKLVVLDLHVYIEIMHGDIVYAKCGCSSFPAFHVQYVLLLHHIVPFVMFVLFTLIGRSIILHDALIARRECVYVCSFK